MNWIDAIDRILPILAYIGPPLCGWIWWSARQRFAVKEDVAVVKEALALLSSRVESVERDMEDLPDTKTLLAIQLALEELRGNMRVQEATLGALKDSVDAMRNNIDMLMQHHLGE